MLVAGQIGNGEWIDVLLEPDAVAPLETSLPAGFVKERLFPMHELVALEFGPDGKLYVTDKTGKLWSWVAPGPPQLVLSILTETTGERGLLGIASIPRSSRTDTFTSSTRRRRREAASLRFTIQNGVASPASELVLWTNTTPCDISHQSGALHFGTDGMLYVAAGDQYVSANAQDGANLNGKILRLAPDGSIPADNPFVGSSTIRPEIWALGLRNPFCFRVDAPTGRIWIADVGGNGADAWEELNLLARGANYGWPSQEGPVCHVSDCSPFTTSRWHYRHDDPRYTGGYPQAAIIGGPVYHGASFPLEYLGRLFVADFAVGWLSSLDLDVSGNVTAEHPFALAPEMAMLSDLDVGPDGALYLAIHYPGEVWRVRWVGSTNAPPLARPSATPATGPAPLSVQFTGSNSLDLDLGPQPLTYHWDFGDGATATVADPQHVYANRGRYDARLTVDDGAETSTASVFVWYGRRPPGDHELPSRRADALFGGRHDRVLGRGERRGGRRARRRRVQLARDPRARRPRTPVPRSAHRRDERFVRGARDWAMDRSTRISAWSSKCATPTASSRPSRTRSHRASRRSSCARTPGSRSRSTANRARHRSCTRASTSSSTRSSRPRRRRSAGSRTSSTSWSTGETNRTLTLTMPARGDRAKAIYRPEDRTTLSVVVPASDRNAEWRPLGGQSESNPFDVNSVCFGTDVFAIECGFEFALPVLRGALVGSRRTSSSRARAIGGVSRGAAPRVRRRRRAAVRRSESDRADARRSAPRLEHHLAPARVRRGRGLLHATSLPCSRRSSAAPIGTRGSTSVSCSTSRSVSPANGAAYATRAREHPPDSCSRGAPTPARRSCPSSKPAPTARAAAVRAGAGLFAPEPDDAPCVGPDTSAAARRESEVQADGTQTARPSSKAASPRRVRSHRHRAETCSSAGASARGNPRRTPAAPRAHGASIRVPLRSLPPHPPRVVPMLRAPSPFLPVAVLLGLALALAGLSTPVHALQECVFPPNPGPERVLGVDAVEHPLRLAATRSASGTKTRTASRSSRSTVRSPTPTWTRTDGSFRPASRSARPIRCAPRVRGIRVPPRARWARRARAPRPRSRRSWAPRVRRSQSRTAAAPRSRSAAGRCAISCCSCASRTTDRAVRTARYRR